jgi:predicted acylesterase/phospholipase RssA
MRASMSVPGLMAPVEIRWQKLVDGGLVDNVPIDEARARCQADIIIAVNVGSPLLKADDIGGLLSVSAQMVNILTEQNVTRSLATLKPTDIYIKPDLEGITAGDFKRSSETADRGAAQPKHSPTACAAGGQRNRLRRLGRQQISRPKRAHRASTKSRSPASSWSTRQSSSATCRPNRATPSTRRNSTPI